VASVVVDVERGGTFITSIERPLHRIDGRPAVKYRRQLWLVEDGVVNLDRGPIDLNGHGAAPAPEVLPVDQHLPAYDPVNVDDSDVRERIIKAGPGAKLLVEAGPGTGKTEMAAMRLAELVSHHLAPNEVLVLSFSRSAVRTLTRRFAKIDCDERVVEELRYLSVRTFDSWAFRMLRALGHQPASLLSNSHDANIAMLVEAATGPDAERLRQHIGNRRHLIVDEFQDLPGVRGDLVLALLDLLAPPDSEGVGFTILGDPAQAIYGFAAGTRSDGSPYPTPREYWNEVAARYASSLQIEVLKRNYRAGSELAQLSERLRSVLLSDRPDNERLDAILAAIAELPESAERLSPEFISQAGEGTRAILTHTNGEAIQVLRSLVGQSVAGSKLPIRLRAGHCAMLPPAWIAGLLSPLRATSLQRSQFSRIYALLCDQWPEATRKALGLPSEETAWDRLASASGGSADDSAISVDDLRERLAWPDSFPDDQALVDQGIVITTVHQSKGMEFDFVTLLEGPEAGEDDDPRYGEDDPGAAASVAYVSITRAGRELDRVPHSQINRPLYPKGFRGNRHRLFNHWGGWVNVEVGLLRDLDPLGFIDPVLHGSDEAVRGLQQFLLENAGQLEGQKVMLCKDAVEDEVFWRVHLQEEDNSPGQLLGRTNGQLTIDLLDVLHPRYFLPSRIFNLRISGVGTVCGSSNEVPLSTEGASRIWLGVGLFGSGDFKPRKKT
jgi:DNA helicase-2/ATP-dependent DNA helicase PcrA